MYPVLIQFVSVFLAGLLAGEEFVIRYGVRAPLAGLDPQPHLQLRQALIRRLRVLVPSIFVLTAASGVAVVVLGGVGPVFAFRCAGALALLAFILITLIGTVPINKGMLDWRVDAPPSNWREIIQRWERLDTARCWAAVVAFGLFVAALAVQSLSPGA